MPTNDERLDAIKRRPCQKVRYPNELEAKIKLARIRSQDHDDHHEQRAYRCPWCRGWHLTSEDYQP